jgi:hypothetical protein
VIQDVRVKTIHAAGERDEASFPRSPPADVPRTAGDVAPPSDAPWTTGPSIDGKGTSPVVDPHSTSSPCPVLQPTPHDMHRGPEATMASDGNGGSPGRLAQLRETFKG